LREIGSWLKTNGEGIYGTQPFTIFGEGPTNAKMVLHGNMKDTGFTVDDIRYTQKGQTVYAFMLEWKEGRKNISLNAFGSNNRIINDAIKKVSILGCESEIKWIQQTNELVIELPEKHPGKNAVAIKIELEEAPGDIFKLKH